MTFREFCLEHGVIVPPDLAADRWQRCGTVSHPRKKNGSVKLSVDGRVGFCHNWETDADAAVWRDGDGKSNGAVFADPEEVAARNARRIADARRATMAARKFYESCPPLLNGHPYLAAKGLSMTGAHGLRVAADGTLVVPMLIRGAVVSVQKISPDGEKKFWFGAPTKGAYYVIERKGYTASLYCEGLATGATLYGAMPNARVIVAFNAGNLPRVAELMPSTGMAAVCADNDHGTESKIGTNPGLDAAYAAAVILRCGVASAPCDDGTDFDDWRQEMMKQERQDNLFRKGHKLTPAQMVANVNAKIRSAIMPALMYIPPHHTAP